MRCINISIIENFNNKLDEFEAKQLSPLTLAYLGDIIHDLFVRSKIACCNSHSKINIIHKDVVKFVNANNQSDSLDFILEDLNEKELSIFKRGRNTKSTPTKNTDKAHYSKATGFECVLGYLYISGQDERLLYILNKSYNFINERSKNSNGTSPIKG